MSKSALSVLLAFVGVAAAAHCASGALTWTTAVSHVGTTTNQLRSVALAQDTGNQSVYIGYIQTSGTRDVFRHDWNAAYAQLNSRGNLATYGFDQPKAIATDDRGNVFVGNRNSGTSTSHIAAHSSTLTFSNSVSAGSPVLGGMTVVKSGASYYAYATYEGGGLVQRYNVTNTAAMVIDTSFDGDGSFTIPGAGILRGIEVDALGNLFVASRDDNKVYKVSADLSTTTSVTLTRAMDVALFGGRVYATSYNGVNSKISVYDSNLAFIEDIIISTLDASPYSRGSSEGWGGIEIGLDGRIWLTDQHYGSAGGTQDRLLVSSPIPAPGALGLLGLGGLIAARRRRD